VRLKTVAASAAAFITWLALAGALVSFVVGAVFAARMTAGGRGRWLAVLVWPLATTRFKDAAREQAAPLNKALVAFIACLMIAAAAWSAAANLHRFAR
jgi:uncharacterized membrane protein YiaA